MFIRKAAENLSAADIEDYSKTKSALWMIKAEGRVSITNHLEICSDGEISKDVLKENIFMILLCRRFGLMFFSRCCKRQFLV